MMNVFLINNNAQCLQAWQGTAQTVYPDSRIRVFNDPMLAIQECVRLLPERVFAACSMRPMDGFAVLRMLRKRYPHIAVCLVGDTEKDRYDARNIQADGYIENELTPEGVGNFEAAYLEMLAASDA